MGRGPVGTTDSWEVIIPIVSLLIHEGLQHALKRPVRPFHHSVRFWSLRGREGFLYPQHVTQFSDDISRKFSTPIAMEDQGASKESDPFRIEQVCYSYGGLIFQRLCYDPLCEVVLEHSDV